MRPLAVVGGDVPLGDGQPQPPGLLHMQRGACQRRELAAPPTHRSPWSPATLHRDQVHHAQVRRGTVCEEVLQGDTAPVRFAGTRKPITRGQLVERCSLVRRYGVFSFLYSICYILFQGIRGHDSAEHRSRRTLRANQLIGCQFFFRLLRPQGLGSVYLRTLREDLPRDVSPQFRRLHHFALWTIPSPRRLTAPSL